MFRIYFLFFILSFLIINSCQTPQKFDAKAKYDSYQQYISGIQAGVVRKSQGVKVFFNESIIRADQIGSELVSGAAQISPSLSGKWIWENAYTLSFISDYKNASSKENYSTQLQLSKIIPTIPDSLKFLNFQFQFQPVMAKVEWNYPEADPEHPNQMRVAGKIKLTEPLDSNIISEFLLLESSDLGKAEIQYFQESEREWNFIISKINRKNDSYSFKISYFISPESKDKKDEKIIEIPGASEFKVTGSESEFTGDFLVNIYFSDHIDRNQDIRSFIKLNPADLNFEYRVESGHLHLRVMGVTEQESASVVLSPGIKSANGKELKSEWEYKLRINQEKPAVRMKYPGSIMPYSDQLLLPFEAINLNQVDVEVFKIFSNNVLFNIHMDYSDNLYSLVKLGRVVHQQTIKLDPDSGNNKRLWRNYALDLNKMIRPEPGAFYEVRLSFQPHYSDYKCDGLKPDLSEYSGNDFSGTDDFISRWNQWGYYDLEEESCYDEENPCCSRYYASNHFARKMVMASDLAMTVKKSDQFNIHYVFIKDILTGAPLADVDLNFYDKQLQIIFSAKTDAQGKFFYEAKNPVNIVVAKRNNNYAYLKLDQGKNLPLSEFEVDGYSSKGGLKTFIYAERGIWRPGDSLLMGIIVNQNNLPIPSSFPILFQLKNPSGKMVFQQNLSQSIFGHFSLKVPTKVDFVTGNYTAIVKAGNTYSEKNVKIETVKPNRYQVAFDVPQNLEPSDEWPAIQCNAKYLYGDPAAGKKIAIDLYYTPLEPKFKDFKTFSFIDIERPEQSGSETVLDAELDENGRAELVYGLDKSGMNHDLKITLESKVIEIGDVSTDYFEHSVQVHKKYLGIKKPESDFGDYFPVGKNIPFELACVDFRGKGKSGEELNIEVFLVDYQWWYEVRNGYGYVSSANKKIPIQSGKIKTDHLGKAKFNFTPTNYDLYYVRVSNKNTGHTSGCMFYSGWTYSGSGSSESEFVQVLKLKSDKEKYILGEKATVQLPEAENGQYMIHVVKDNKIIKTDWINATRSKTVYELMIAKGMEPNVYLDIALIQSVKGQNKDLPIRMYGIVPIVVENSERRLNPIIKCSDLWRPGQIVELEVSEQKGREMAYQLFVVEEGLLGLTRFKTPDPYGHFFQKESMDLYTWDNYSQIIGAVNGQFDGVFSIGGDQAVDPSQLAKLKRFKPLSMTSGLQRINAGAIGKHRFEIPNYNGAVRVMVVANNDKDFGFSEKNIPVKAELMTEILMPRVMSIQDQLQLPVTITTTEHYLKDVVVKLSASGPMKIEGSAIQNVHFDQPGEKKIFFKVNSTGKLAPAQIRVELTSGSARAFSEVELFIDNPNPVTRHVKEYWLEPGKLIDENISPYGMKGSRSARFELSAFAGRSIEDLRSQLVRYPHGCAEQTASIAFGQLHLDALMSLDSNTSNAIQNNIRSGIQKLLGFQKDNGGFSYWAGENEAADYVSSYIGHFLLEAKSKSYLVSQDALNKWQQFQLNLSRSYLPKKSSDEFYLEFNQAYRLFTLALSGRPDWSGMNLMLGRERKNVMSGWWLAGAYAISGKNDVAQKIITGLISEPKPYRESFYHFGSDIRDESVISMILTHLNKKSDAAKILNRTLKKMSGSYYPSTQEMAFTLVSCAKVFGQFSQNSSQIKFQYQWGGKTKDFVLDYPVFVQDLEDLGAGRFYFKNTSDRPVNLQIIQTGKSEVQRKVSENHGLKLEVQYMDEKFQKLDLQSVPVGSRISAHIQITNESISGVSKNFALTAAFPACFEINNQRIGGIQNVDSRIHNMDFRDDRIYFYFNLPNRNTISIHVPLVVNSLGVFMAPDFIVEAMYEPSVYSILNLGKVTVEAKR